MSCNLSLASLRAISSLGHDEACRPSLRHGRSSLNSGRSGAGSTTSVHNRRTEQAYRGPHHGIGAGRHERSSDQR